MAQDTVGASTKNPALFRMIAPVALGSFNLYNKVVHTCSPNPTFFDTRDFPWVEEVEAYYPDIREECIQAVSDLNKVPNCSDMGEGTRKLAQDEDWKAFVLMLFGEPIRPNVARCPKTYEALQKIPGVKTALFSILAPGKHLARHTGYFAGILRYHLGVLVPGGNQCRISVDDETRTWDEGKSLIFDDSHPHEVWNDSDQIRVVLFVDFPRPMPFYLRPSTATYYFALRNTFGKDMIRNVETASQ